MYFLGICQIFSDIIIVSEFGAPLPIRPPPQSTRGRETQLGAYFLFLLRLGPPWASWASLGPSLALLGLPWADWGDLGENESNLIRFSAGSLGGSGDSGGTLGLLG